MKLLLRSIHIDDGPSAINAVAAAASCKCHLYTISVSFKETL